MKFGIEYFSRNNGDPIQIETLKIKNFRLFKDVEMKGLSPMTVLVGANGTGKSTLFDVFSFLKDRRNIACNPK